MAVVLRPIAPLRPVPGTLKRHELVNRLDGRPIIRREAEFGAARQVATDVLNSVLSGRHYRGAGHFPGVDQNRR